MDWEAPADAWYVWLGVSIVSLAIAGVVLGLPTGPPPDAEGATNAIEETSASPYESASTLEHDADAIAIDGKSVTMRNEHGIARSSIRYGQVVAVNGDEGLERLVYGEDFETVFDDELEDPHENAATVFMDRVADAEADNSGEWLTASDELFVRQVAVEPNELPSIRVAGADHERPRHGVWDDAFREVMGYDQIPTAITIQYDDVDAADVEYTIDGAAHLEAFIDDHYDSFTHFWETDRYVLLDVVPDEGDVCWEERDCDETVDPEDRVNIAYEAGIDTSDEGVPVQQGAGSDAFTLQSHIEPDTGENIWAGGYPLTVTAEFDDRTCSAELRDDRPAELCPQSPPSDERAAELDWIELNDETEEYHVTLVVV